MKNISEKNSSEINFDFNNFDFDFSTTQKDKSNREVWDYKKIIADNFLNIKDFCHLKNETDINEFLSAKKGKGSVCSKFRVQKLQKIKNVNFENLRQATEQKEKMKFINNIYILSTYTKLDFLDFFKKENQNLYNRLEKLIGEFLNFKKNSKK